MLTAHSGCIHLKVQLEYIHLKSVSHRLANLHLQVPTQLPLQGSDDLISPSKDDFQRRRRFALPPYSLFSELPSQFSSLHSQSACVVLLTPAVRTHTKKDDVPH